jgi:hypothetical protein
MNITNSNQRDYGSSPEKDLQTANKGIKSLYKSDINETN